MMIDILSCLDKGDVLIGGAVTAVGVFLHKFLWSKAVSKSECKRVHDLEALDRAEIKEDVRMLIRHLIDPNYKKDELPK